MNQNGLKLMERLTEHVKAQMSTRATEGYKKSIQPAKSTSAERKAILDEIVKFIGIPLKELQVKLNVNRSTWERWEKMESIPKKAHLDYLGRMIRDVENESANPANQQPLTQPYEFIGASPRTYGQLRVLFSHRAYNWEDAVFHFRTPFQDAGYILDLVSLALNGCKVVYLMKTTQLMPSTVWAETFVRNMKETLGIGIANQVLACLCIVKIGDDEDSLPTDFGVLNFESGKEVEKVGYIWLGKEGSDSAEFIKKPNQYQAIPGNDSCFDMLMLRYSKQLDKAFEIIKENRAKPVPPTFDCYDDTQHKYKYTIFVIDESSEPQPLTIYV